MLEDKVKEVFADMVVLKDPQRSEYFSNLSIPSYMRDWLVMKFSDDDGVVDYDSVRRYIKRYIPNREDFEQYKFQMVNGENVQFLARVRVSVDVRSGKTLFELPDFGGSRGGAAGVVSYVVAEEWQDTLLHESENWGIITLTWTMEGTPSPSYPIRRWSLPTQKYETAFPSVQPSEGGLTLSPEPPATFPFSGETP